MAGSPAVVLGRAQLFNWLHTVGDYDDEELIQWMEEEDEEEAVVA